MTLTITLVLVALTAVVIAYPLFFSRLQHYLIREERVEFNEAEALLAALSELEDEYQLGRLGKRDYQTQKLALQRHYLALRDEDAPSPKEDS